MALPVGAPCPTGTFLMTPTLVYLRLDRFSSCCSTSSVWPDFDRFLIAGQWKPRILSSILCWLVAPQGLLLALCFILKAAVSSTFGCGPEGIAFKEESSLAIWGAVGEAFSHVVLDHGTDVFIWLGAELAAQEGKSAAALAACRTLSEELTEMLFLAPRILAFKEGSSSIFSFSVDTSTQRSSLWTGGKISAAPNFDHETKNKAEKKLSSLWRS